jgi:hypothetical protein
MKTARTISIKVNPRERRTGKLTRYAANHNRGAHCLPACRAEAEQRRERQSNGGASSGGRRSANEYGFAQHKVWRCEGTFLFTIGRISLWPYCVILVAQ